MSRTKTNPEKTVIRAIWAEPDVMRIAIEGDHIEEREWGKWRDAICSVPGPGAKGARSKDDQVCFIKFAEKEPQAEFVERCLDGIRNQMEFLFPHHPDMWNVDSIFQYGNAAPVEEEMSGQPEPSDSVANVVEAREMAMIGVATGKLSFQEAYAALVNAIGDEFDEFIGD